VTLRIDSSLARSYYTLGEEAINGTVDLVVQSLYEPSPQWLRIAESDRITLTSTRSGYYLVQWTLATSVELHYRRKLIGQKFE
jgi:hypothetical protein